MIYKIVTFGCQMNKSRSEHLDHLMQEAGFREAFSGERAEILMFNTCAVRDHAAHKAVSAMNRAISEYGNNTEPIIVVFGCLPELIQDELSRKIPQARILAGTRELDELPRLIRQSVKKKDLIRCFNQPEQKGFLERGYRRKPGLLAYLPITYGCNNFCSYCVVPYTTGRQTSKPVDLILEEIRNIQDEGFPEVVLLGQNVNSYGADLDPAPSFETLLEAVEDQLKSTGTWIRFLTSHPKDMRRSIVNLVEKSRLICPYFHFPLQSGSNRILQKMNRGYTREKYLEMVHYIRRTIPQAGIGTDIIVGFPGETEAEFQQTLEMVSEAAFDLAYTYTYSPRPRTSASGLMDDVSAAEKKERLFQLNDLVRSLYQRKIKSWAGKESLVLVERREPDPVGRTFGGQKVYLSGSLHLEPGQVCRVRFADRSTGRLEGAVLDEG